MRLLLLSLLLLCGFASADVEMRIIDTGPGLATITRFDNGEVMVFDTGHWYYDDHVMAEINKFMGDDATEVALFVASVTDADHIGATDDLFNNYHVKKVIRTGYERDSAIWRAHNAAIEAAEGAGLTHDIDLSKVNLAHGTSYLFGETRVTILSGFYNAPSVWGMVGSQYRNANSIVVRIDYKGKSILLAGDAMGREALTGGEMPPADAPAVATERYLIDNSGVRPIAADVLIAPHHGSDQASSTEFIKAVAPRWVVFSAGHAKGYPKSSTVERYKALGISDECLLRLDLGDHEKDKGEWDYGRKRNYTDITGENPVQIILPASGDPKVSYAGKDPVTCPSVITAQRKMIGRKKVKKSNGGICHEPASSWYEATEKFTKYDSLEDCLASGGRLPE
ncbi:beta-lactamase superfamily II metal-dependent hydrolase [Alteromonadaceae bacterium 2753L.S.0a.02]|nr:beta-lactamase superfamily II metal-dependent hydrolase [Alteromonadaceae bacterium 2753L.S.0a.02]